ncbi:hypothetical protein NO1_0260 [Candidatus Termititenax aidoneus]|uniref:Uncharacterized protein n=1 Tax=Termititenax aidoneus TaxID=2218524 RepID=A0A388T9M8_TERA1|nr:hypothetical protein NO1_0260 [Candidatus Termititenax aidoneus]
MAQIYERQVLPDATPRQLDTSAAQNNLQKATQIIKTGQSIVETQAKMAAHNAEVERKRQQQQQQIAETSAKKAAEQIIKNAYTVYGTQAQKYEENISENLEKLYETIPDGPAKNSVMGEIGIIKSGYDAHVTDNINKIQQKQHNISMADDYITDVDTAKSSLSNLFFTPGEIANELSAETLQKAVAGSDAAGMINRAYGVRNAVDQYGNSIFSEKQRTHIEELHDNMGYYAAIDYMQDKVMNNRALAVQQLQWFTNNKQTVMDAFKLDDQQYEKTLKDMRSILDGQITAGQLEVNNFTLADINAGYKNAKIEITDGQPKSEMNFNTALEFSAQIDNAINNGNYNTTAEYNKLQDQKAVVDRIVVDMVERGKTVKHKWWGENAGEAGENLARKNVELLSSLSGIADKNFINALKVEHYRAQAGFFQERGLKLTSSDKQNIDDARGIAKNTFIRQAERLVGKQKVDEGQDAFMIYSAALEKWKRSNKKNNLQERLK